MVIRELAAINLRWASILAEERYRAERLGPPLVRASTPDGASALSGDQASEQTRKHPRRGFWRELFGLVPFGS